MNLVISTGTNIGDRIANLDAACNRLSEEFSLVAKSRIYSSKAVDYTDQPDFLNQVLTFEIPMLAPASVIEKVLSIETSMGRVRNIDKGPRTIDIDILFWGIEEIDIPNLIIPHPRLFERSFIVLPLKELDVFNILKEHFNFPCSFSNKATPLDK